MFSRATFELLKSTETIFAFFFLKLPRITSTSSPFLTGRLLLPCFFLNSFDKLALKNLCLIWNGALYLYFLCFLGCLLAFHDTEKSLFIFFFEQKPHRI